MILFLLDLIHKKLAMAEGFKGSRIRGFKDSRELDLIL